MHSQRGRFFDVPWLTVLLSLPRCHRVCHGRGRWRAWGRGESPSRAPLRVRSTLPGRRATWLVSDHDANSDWAHGSQKGVFGLWGRDSWPRRCGLLAANHGNAPLAWTWELPRLPPSPVTAGVLPLLASTTLAAASLSARWTRWSVVVQCLWGWRPRRWRRAPTNPRAS